MTKLHFSKTRICYWDSARSELKLPADPNTLPDGVTLLGDNESRNYRIAQLAAATHNWHTIPYNTYGYYCTPAEMNAVYENSNSVTPLNCKVTIGHNIPLSRNATTNATQLSFNNTIYSLIVDLPPNDHVTTEIDFLTVPEHNAFCRTFDGSLYDTLNRNVLPKPNIMFKVPRAKHTDSLFPNATSTSAAADFTNVHANNTTFFEEKTSFGETYTQNGLVNAYLPELMQDNNHIKVLYPGENQDVFSVDFSVYKDLATIPTDSVNFNESFTNIDSRNFGTNMLNCAFPNSMMMFMSLVPVLRGPWDNYGMDASFNLQDTPYTVQDDADRTNVERLNLILWSEIQQSKGGMTHADTFTKGLPIKFIKCLPIMDQANSVVTHTVCGTITWDLELEVTDRIYKNINPLKWEMVWPVRTKTYSVNANNVISGTGIQETFASGWPKRPLNDAHTRSLKLRRRAYVGPATNWVPYTGDFRPAVLAMNTDAQVWDNLPCDTEQCSNMYTNAVYNETTTCAFKLTGIESTEKITHKSDKEPKSKGKKK